MAGRRKTNTRARARVRKTTRILRPNGVMALESFKINKQSVKLWCGAVLVVIGLFFLLINFGIPAQAIGKLWPLVVVGFGFAILLQR